MPAWPPVDSADVRELREAEAESLAREAELDRLHAEECVDGWLGGFDGDAPRPCLRCRRHLARAGR